MAAAIYNLTEGFENEPAQISISGVSSPIPNLYPYIQHADPENTADLQKLNTLAEQIGNMTLEEQRLFSGALELECTGGLDDAIHIAGGLERYEIFPKIMADADLGRFLVDTAFMTGRFSFPEETKPYLDYAKIGAEQRDTLGGVYTPHGMVRRREEVPVQTIDGCMDFDQLGRDTMEEDGVRQTGYGLVRRLSKPFPPEQTQGHQMGGQIG